MSITPNPDANFTPGRGNYTDLKPFRFWCQKVLPLVYDDSLSYYELLCKVVDYLNKTMEDVETLEGDITSMYTAFEQLQAYVNHYFDSLDVQEEINNKLDAMAASGALLTIIQPTISTTTSEWLSQHITNPSNPPIDTSLTVRGAAADAKVTGDRTNTLRGNFAPAFSTSTNYKTGDYITYENAYDVYRFNNDKSAGEWDPLPLTPVVASDEVTRAISSKTPLFNEKTIVNTIDLEQGTFASTNANKSGSNARIRLSRPWLIKKGTSINFTAGNTIKKYFYLAFDLNGNRLTYPSNGQFVTDENTYLNFSADVAYLYLIFASENDGNITPNDFDAEVYVIQNTVHTVTVHMESGERSSSDPNRFGTNLTRHLTHVRNKYPLMLNGNKIVFMPPADFDRFIFYADANGNYVNYLRVSTEGTIIKVPDGVVAFDFDFASQENFEISVEMFGGDAPYETKRIYKNSGQTIRLLFDVDRSTDLFSGMCFRLPPNYDPNGKKVPLFIWFAGTGGYAGILSGFPTVEVKGVEYLRDEGYAVLQVFSVGSYYYNKYPTAGSDQPYPMPITEKCIQAGLEYFCDRYNVDINEIHVAGLSFGGIMGFHYVIRPLKGMKSATLFDPCIDTLSMRGRFSDSRKLIAEELKFTGDLTSFYDINEDGTTSTGVENYYFSERCIPFWRQNMAGLIRINPAWDCLINDTYGEKFDESIDNAQKWWRNGKHTADNIYTKTNYNMVSTLPLKIVGVKDDDSTPHQIMTEKIEQLRNAGNPAEITLYDTGGHTSTSYDTTGAITQNITTALGIACQNVPVAWIHAVEWARLNS